jgi:hypothetical protein
MRKFLIYLIFLLPTLAYGQLFPELPELKGNIKKIVEKRYGKEVTNPRLIDAIFRPKAFSGGKYLYEFDEHTKLLKRTNILQGKVIADYSYERKTIDNRIVVREKMNNNENDSTGDYIEFENFIDPKGKVIKVNFWAFSEQKNNWEIFQVDQNAEYSGDRLNCFTRYQTNEKGDFSNGEKFSFFYNASGQLTQIERLNLASGFRTVIGYEYNEKGLIINSTIDFLVEIQEYKKTQIQKISYQYDSRGNWVKKYIESGDKNILEAKRKIIYL